MKSPVVRRLEAIGVLVEHREALTDEQLIDLLRSALGIETLGQKRSRAGREGGLKSVDSRRSSGGTAQPKQAPKQTRSRPPDASEPRPEAKPEAPPNQARSKTAPASVVASEANPPPLHSPSGSGSPAKEKAAESEGSDRSPAQATAAASRPRNHEEALTEPAAYVAGLCFHGETYDTQYAHELGVHRMPWVVEPVRAWREARGDAWRELRAGDGEVKAMARLAASGHLLSDVVRVARYLPTTEKHRDKVLASCMSPDTVLIALVELRERPQRSAFADDMVRRVDAGARPSALGDLLPKAAGDRE